MTIQQNTNRIQTTHIGSLPRPHKLLDILKKKFSRRDHRREGIRHHPAPSR